MSTAVRAFSASKELAFSNEKENVELNKSTTTTTTNIKAAVAHDEAEKGINVDDHEEEVDVVDDEEDDDKLKSKKELDLGPQVSLKEQLEKDKV